MEYEWRVTLSTASHAQSKEGIPPWLLRLFLLPGGWNDHSCRVIPEGLCSKSRGPFIFCLVRQTTSENGSFLPTHHHQPKTMNTKNNYTGCQITIDTDRQTHEGPFVTESHSWRTGTFQMSWSHFFKVAKGLQEIIPSMFLPEGSLKGDALG